MNDMSQIELNYEMNGKTLLKLKTHPTGESIEINGGVNEHITKITILTLFNMFSKMFISVK